MTSFNWTIAPLCLAMGNVDRSMTLIFRDPGIKQDGPVLAWLLRGGNETILVDTGPSGPARPIDPVFSQTPDQTLEAQLGRFDVRPDAITMIINTHLHTDHCSGNGYFPNVPCFVQESEMAYAKDPFPVHRPAYDVELEGMNFRTLRGDHEVVPGVRVIHTPGHSPGSQAVSVETRNGLYILAGDSIPTYENMRVPDNEPFWPSGIYVDLGEYYKSLDRLKASGGPILPSHDSMVLDKAIYP
jgi:N-acyl homoserine lactone hydrolase